VAGQPLVLLDQTAAQSELAAAEARQQEAQAENTIIGAGGKPGVVASLESSVQTATAAVQVAQRNYDSMLRLQEHQAATKLQVNEAKDALDRAKLQLASAQAQRRSVVTTNDRAVAQAKLNDARAAVLLARRGLSLRSVVAPLTGTVYQFDLKIGSYLQPGQEVGLVGCLDKMKVTMYVDEPDLGRVALGMPAIITWDARPGEKWQGEVTGLPTEVTALSSRTVGEVTTYVNNPGHVLLPGVSVNATIVSRLVKDALAVPKAALRNAHGETGVFQLQGKALAWTKVTAGVSDLNNVQIVSGLQPGALVADRVISPGDAELVSGMKVRVNRDR
jgi:multidrug efflux pump subunit AcrA (membrane-fusion protein)